MQVFPIHPKRKGALEGESQKFWILPKKKNFKKKNRGWKLIVFVFAPKKKNWAKIGPSIPILPGAGREGPLFGALPERRQPLRSEAPGGSAWDVDKHPWFCWGMWVFFP